MICGWCEEEIDPTEPREQKGNMHDECAFGALFSVSHIQRRCSCYVQGSEEPRDPRHLTRREAARQSVQLARMLDSLGVLWMNERL